MKHNIIARTIGLAGISACLAGAALPAGSAGPRLTAEAWNVEVAPGECTLTRSIATPIPVTLSLRTITGTDSYRLAVVGKTLPRQNARELFPATIVFAADRHFERGARGVALANDLGNAIVIQGLDPEVIAAFAGASSIGVESKSGSLGPFALPNAKAAIGALAGCVRDQLVEWGADAAQFEPGGKPLVALVGRDDWVPNAELLKMPMGTDLKLDAVFKVSVAADGSVDGCAPVGASVDAKVTKIACGAVLARRLFTPASDAQGKPVRGVAAFEIHLYGTPTRGAALKTRG